MVWQNHFLNVCRYSVSNFEYLQVQLIDNNSVQKDDDVVKVLLEEKNSFKGNYLS